MEEYLHNFRYYTSVGPRLDISIFGIFGFYNIYLVYLYSSTVHIPTNLTQDMSQSLCLCRHSSTCLPFLAILLGEILSPTLHQWSFQSIAIESSYLTEQQNGNQEGKKGRKEMFITRSNLIILKTNFLQTFSFYQYQTDLQ